MFSTNIFPSNEAKNVCELICHNNNNNNQININIIIDKKTAEDRFFLIIIWLLDNAYARKNEEIPGPIRHNKMLMERENVKANSKHGLKPYAAYEIPSARKLPERSSTIINRLYYNLFRDCVVNTTNNDNQSAGAGVNGKIGRKGGEALKEPECSKITLIQAML